jgi:GTP-binding protein Era
MQRSLRAGFIGLVGRPNVGKSTLMNAILGEKIAIASPRPQTTRNRILGVRNLSGAQLVLLDTPGLHKPSGKGRTKLNQYMVREAIATLEEVDALTLIVEGAPERPDRFVLDELSRVKKPVVLALNKVDLVRDKQRLLPMLAAWGKAHPFAAMVPISSLTHNGVTRLVEELVKLLPEADKPLFPEEMLTDRAERWLGAELIREQAFVLLGKELPYALAVTIDEWNERGRDVMVSATVHIEKPSQKRIVVGEGGRMVREIGSRARAEIARLIGCPVHLKLFVRVDEGWTQNSSRMRDMGYE